MFPKFSRLPLNFHLKKINKVKLNTKNSTPTKMNVGWIKIFVFILHYIWVNLVELLDISYKTAGCSVLLLSNVK